jgi:16S rRNA (guanine527-N7)-methyltransferase
MSPPSLAERWLREGAGAFGLELSSGQVRSFLRYRDLLRNANRQTNLTGLVSDEEIVVKHFLDSLSGRLLFRPQTNDDVLDLGPGGGFPSLPLALVDPIFSLLLLEPRQRACDFLAELIVTIGLPQAAVRRDRAEPFGRGSGREIFHWVLARAVAKLNVLLELALPLLQVGGRLLAWKGDQVEEEMEQAAYAMGQLGGEIEAIRQVQLPHWGLERHLLLVRKVAPTAGRYPRRNGLPQKRPLFKPGESPIIEKTWDA